MNISEQEFLYKKNKYMTEFILLYKSMPCLWRLKSKTYHMREVRNKAYKQLVKKLRQIDPTADRITVVKKINSLRSSLRKEKRKVAQLVKEGVPYKPRLWYYNLFDFLDEVERGKQGDDCASEESEEPEPNIKLEEGKEYEVEYEEEDDDPLHSYQITQDESSADASPPPKRDKIAVTEFSQASSSKIAPEHRISKIQNFEETPKHGSREDQYDVFGKNVAAKLRDIAFRDNTQRLMAEKIVNDALFLAELGQLTLAHCNKLHAEIDRQEAGQ